MKARGVVGLCNTLVVYGRVFPVKRGGLQSLLSSPLFLFHQCREDLFSDLIEDSHYSEGILCCGHLFAIVYPNNVAAPL